ncbi:MAG: GDP-mannose 4,6-dehydratase [Acidimicrobiales bacterium]
MRVLVTGAGGFVGGWLVPYLASQGDEVCPMDRSVDVRSHSLVCDAIAGYGPDAIYHLAGFANVGLSWDQPQTALEVNAIGALNVLEAARRCARMPKVLLLSSAEIYGEVSEEDLPLVESSPARPMTPYAVSKVAVEYLGLQAYLAHGLPVVTVRPFNHVGPGQPLSFFVPAMAQRIIDAAKAGNATLPAGNLSSRRDFTDVRDVVRAYRMLIEKGEPGETYNVCTGQDVPMTFVAKMMAELTGSKVAVVQDPSLIRPADIPVLRGDPGKLKSITGWSPSYSLRDTLKDVIEWRRCAV